MEKIFKKSLALVLSAALCLTALIGCLTVSAEGASATVTVGTVEVNSDATKATVPVTVKTDDANGIAAAMFELKVDSSKLTFNSVWEESITWDDKTNINVQTVLGELDAEGTTQRVVPVSGETDTYRFLVEAIKDGSSDTLGYIKSATFNITFDIVAGTTGTINIEYVNDAHSQACNGGTFDVNTATYSGTEALIPLTGANGAVTVKTTVACEHDWKFVSAVPATGSDNSANTETSKGSITLQCSKCNVKKTEPVNYNYYARTAMVGINLESETIMRFGARYERDFSRISTGANITKGYIVLDQVRGDVQVSSKVTSFADCDDAVDASNYKVYNATIGLIAVAMSDNVSSNVYAYDETTDAWYNGMTLTSSIASTGLAILQTSKVDLQKTMLVNLLNYGAAVQTEKDVNTANLANANIADYQNYAKAADEITDTISLPTTTDDAKIFWFNKFQLLLDSKITNAASFRLTSAYTGEDKDTAIDMTGYTVEIKYTNFKGTPIVIEVPSSEFLPEGRVNRHTVEMPFDAADLRAKVTYSVKLNGESAGPESVCSIEALVNGVLKQSSTSAARKVSLNAMMAYSDAAKAYLISK